MYVYTEVQYAHGSLKLMDTLFTEVGCLSGTWSLLVLLVLLARDRDYWWAADVGFSSVYCECILLPLVNKEALWACGGAK